MDRISVDPDAKLKINLNKATDSNGQPYYIGKLQFPGSLDWHSGISFMVFTSEEGYEELQIAPVDPFRRSKAKRSSLGYKGSRGAGRMTVDLHPFLDGNDQVAYVGEASMPATETDCTHGLFFTIFLSRTDEEELQISRLDHSIRKKTYENSERTDESGYRRLPDRRVG